MTTTTTTRTRPKRPSRPAARAATSPWAVAEGRGRARCIGVSSVDPLPLKLRAAWRGQDPPITIEHNRARECASTMTFQVAEFVWWTTWPSRTANVSRHLLFDGRQFSLGLGIGVVVLHSLWRRVIASESIQHGRQGGANRCDFLSALADICVGVDHTKPQVIA